MAESVAREAHRLSHEKASFLDAAVQGLRPRLQASTEKFQAYFLALFSDKDYTKVLGSFAKVDKAHKKAAPAPSQASTQPVRLTSRPNRWRCFSCGILGHTAANCSRRQQRARYAPYYKPFGYLHFLSHSCVFGLLFRAVLPKTIYKGVPRWTNYHFEQDVVRYVYARVIFVAFLILPVLRSLWSLSIPPFPPSLY